jgi:hypothetical protein
MKIIVPQIIPAVPILVVASRPLIAALRRVGVILVRPVFVLILRGNVRLMSVVFLRPLVAVRRIVIIILVVLAMLVNIAIL